MDSITRLSARAVDEESSEAQGTPATALSIVIPIYNEEGNIPLLCRGVTEEADKLGKSYEIICVNDGSTDRSIDELRAAAGQRREIKVINFRRNCGQTAAMMAGIQHASGAIILSLDADLQNDPADIPRLLAKLDEGYDVVSGWRKDRKDYKVRRTLVSRVANSVISWISGVPLHDYGCTLKAYRCDVLKDVRLYGEMHRFIPIYATWLGARVAEIPVTHRPRTIGKSKYGLGRIFKVILDLVVVKFMDRHITKPIYIIGGFGLVSLLISALAGFAALYLKIFDGISFISTPLPLLCVMSFITGIMCILLGLVAEINVRIYFESQDKTPYSIRDRINF